MQTKHNPSPKELVIFKELGLEFIHNETSLDVYYKCSAKVLTDTTPDWIHNSIKSAMRLLLINPNINTTSEEFQDCIDEIVFLPTNKKCVHTEHCCIIHGCKYSERDCVVENGIMAQSFPCELCHDSYYDSDKPIKPIIVTKKLLEKIKNRKDDDDVNDLLLEILGE